MEDTAVTGLPMDLQVTRESRAMSTRSRTLMHIDAPRTRIPRVSECRLMTHDDSSVPGSQDAHLSTREGINQHDVSVKFTVLTVLHLTG